MNDSINIRKYIGITLSSLHVGARSRTVLRAIDNSVARDIDDLPVIPATTLKGAARAYSFMDFGLVDCDGKGNDCPQPHICSSCAVYGYTSHRSGQGSTSLVQFNSARLLFCPTQTPYGIVWLASVKRVIESGLISSEIDLDYIEQRAKNHNTFFISRTLSSVIENTDLILGLKELSTQNFVSINTESWHGPEEVENIYNRCILVPEEQYGAIVNSTLQVHTSIAINGATGTAKPGALFAMEAVPRDTVFLFEIGFINPVRYGIQEFINEKSEIETQLPSTLTSTICIVEDGLDKYQMLGIGGKRSRGYGRFKVYPLSPKPRIHGEESHQQEDTPRVFLSYSHKDVSFVRKLTSDLQRRKIQVWLDEREIIVGDSIHSRISEGVSQANFMVIAMSRTSLKSGWVERELNAGLMQEVDRKQTVVLPILIENISEAEIPTFIRDRHYADFVEDYNQGLHRLVYSIRKHLKRMRANP